MFSVQVGIDQRAGFVICQFWCPCSILILTSGFLDLPILASLQHCLLWGPSFGEERWVLIKELVQCKDHGFIEVSRHVRRRSLSIFDGPLSAVYRHDVFLLKINCHILMVRALIRTIYDVCIYDVWKFQYMHSSWEWTYICFALLEIYKKGMFSVHVGIDQRIGFTI